MTRAELDEYWRYYLYLEKMIIESKTYVEINHDNYSVYSVFYHRAIISIGCELDTFFKAFCGFDLDDNKCISDYARAILSDELYSNIVNETITLRESREIIKPFENWNAKKAKKSLTWWEAFDSLKHGRKANMKEANLENVINILGALYLLESKAYYDTSDNDKPDIPFSDSKFFYLKWDFKWQNATDILLFKDVD